MIIIALGYEVLVVGPDLRPDGLHGTVAPLMLDLGANPVTLTDIDGTFEYSTVVSTEVHNPLKFELGQNYPNPFNPETTIGYTITKDGKVQLAIFDLLGRQIRNLVNDYKNSGYYLIWGKV